MRRGKFVFILTRIISIFFVLIATKIDRYIVLGRSTDDIRWSFPAFLPFSRFFLLVRLLHHHQPSSCSVSRPRFRRIVSLLYHPRTNTHHPYFEIHSCLPLLLQKNKTKNIISPIIAQITAHCTHSVDCVCDYCVCYSLRVHNFLIPTLRVRPHFYTNTHYHFILFSRTPFFTFFPSRVVCLSSCYRYSSSQSCRAFFMLSGPSGIRRGGLDRALRGAPWGARQPRHPPRRDPSCILVLGVLDVVLHEHILLPHN